MTKYKLLLLLSFLVIAVTAYAQEAKTGSKINVSFQPLFLLNNAVKADVDILPKGRFGLLGGLEIYTGTPALYNPKLEISQNQKDEIKGYGINLAAKYMFSKSGKTNSFYLSPGITYRNLKLNISGERYYTYTENNLEYYSHGLREDNYTLNPLMIYANIGYQAVLSDIAFVDIYMGFAQKFVGENEDLKYLRRYHEPTYGYAYKGFLIQAGIKIGAKIK